jgi:hypothetical protein
MSRTAAEFLVQALEKTGVRRVPQAALETALAHRGLLIFQFSDRGPTPLVIDAPAKRADECDAESARPS